MNENLKNVKISGIRRFYNEVKKFEGAISLTLGQPDLEMPLIIKEALIEAINENRTVYTENAGITELRSEISKYLNKLKINYSKDEICITVGGSEALFSVFTSLINLGDKVLIPTPAYPAYENIVSILGGNVINYSLNYDFSLNVDEIAKKIEEENIKYMVLSYPCNPTGATLTKIDRERLVELIKKHDIIVITDEIYESLCFDEYYSIAQREEVSSKIIYVSGFSKMFSMTGLRVGYFACKKNIMNEVMKVHQYNVSCASSIAQYATCKGLKCGLHEVEKMKGIFNNRRDYVVKRLKGMGMELFIPNGAFYVFPSIKQYGMSSEEFCMDLLYTQKVACVPGSAFGSGGEGYIRISYCYSDEELEEAMNRLEKYIKIKFQ